MSRTSIEWADVVWNPVTGCTKVSEGCRNCYAERVANRFWGERKFNQVVCHEERLEDPLRWRKPRRVFVNSMSDLFHPDVPFAFISAVFNRMEIARQHTFMVLTKRPERMVQFCYEFGIEARSNIWLGVSVENQKAADERIPLLLQTPAAVRFVSCEPLLGAVDLSLLIPPKKLTPEKVHINALLGESLSAMTGCMISDELPALDWVICGGESGPGARPMHPDWARGLRDQCRGAEVPFFFKQWGEWFPQSHFYRDQKKVSLSRRDGAIGDAFGVYRFPPGNGGSIFTSEKRDDTAFMVRVGKAKAGRVLDGRVWDERPEEPHPCPSPTGGEG